ncbi:MAG: hypothetical protein IPO32_04225 [Crocinitomicaceae bacterium]|jgi:hypothetical protein|nr:hypothetical protein [Crocinitomicaceae bacterium]MBK9590734.1 hypothetical protein [Crocinitomicaceae bacterium]
MAGGKETPRQKMIGMMYLVLTALLALNVSKQIVAAFVTLNDKLDASATIINNKNEDTHAEFDKKRAALVATKGDMKLLEFWQGNATTLKKETALVVSYLLGECNEMIKTAEGVDWIAEEGGKDADGNIVKLKPLMEIQGMDNYDIPTGMFVGGNPNAPVQRGLDIRLKIHEYRDKIASLMGTYEQGKDKKWSFTAPADETGLGDALKTCNPADTAKIGQFYRALTLPEKLHAHEDGAEDMPWPSVIFDHAPIVAAAAMFTSLKLDVKNAESMATEYMLSKVEAPVFNFNKIEPLAFARTGYINQGDSLALSVMIAAYDSNEVSKIRYGMDADTSNKDAWKEVTGKIGLDGSKPGFHKVKGEIGVKEKGELAWKPWEFTYTVGQPMGVVALPEMRVLYWGYDNVVEGTASGFDPSKVTLSGSGCSLSGKGNGQYIAKVSQPTRSAKISISGKKDDGSSVSLGSFDFVCKPIPPATIYFGKTEAGGTCQYTAAKNQPSVRVALDPAVPLTTVTYSVLGGSLYVSGIPGEGKVNSGGAFDDKAKSLLNQSKGKTVMIEVKYKGPDGISRIGATSFKVQ